MNYVMVQNRIDANHKVIFRSWKPKPKWLCGGTTC